MKIGIISMQRVKNNGSFLQAYALYSKLKAYRHDVEFIDYNDEMHAEEKKQVESFSKRVFKTIKSILNPKYRRLVEVAKHRQLFNEKYTSFLSDIGLTKAYNYHSGKEFDLIVIGSDEVFNICQYSDKNYAIPWELFAEGLHTHKVITYAASCGQTSLQKVGEIQETEHCKELLSRFSAVSVRDENTYNFVRGLTGSEPIYHIDPVLWMDEFPKDPLYKKPNYKYLLVYAYTMRMNSEAEQVAIKTYAKKHGLKIICVNCYQPWCDVKITTTPFALLEYIRDAECVVTDTFHGTVFSIRNNTKFVTIVRESNRNKLRSLLKQFSLSAREVSGIENFEKIMEAPIDFETVNRTLDIERNRSKEYIESQISF